MPDRAGVGRRPGAVLIYHEGRHVACVQGGELRVTIHSTKGHVLRCVPGPGLAFNLNVMENGRRAGAVALCITDADTGRRYRATLAHFRAHSIPFDFGYGPQRCLPFAFWSIEEPAPGPLQLGLGL